MGYGVRGSPVYEKKFVVRTPHKIFNIKFKVRYLYCFELIFDSVSEDTDERAAEFHLSIS